MVWYDCQYLRGECDMTALIFLIFHKFKGRVFHCEAINKLPFDSRIILLGVITSPCPRYRVPTWSLFPGKVLTFDHGSLGPGKVLSFNNSSKRSWKSPYFLIKSRSMNAWCKTFYQFNKQPIPKCTFCQFVFKIWNRYPIKSDVMSQKLKSNKIPHICGVFGISALWNST